MTDLPCRRIRLAVVLSHPIQYFSPWFRHITDQPPLQIKVFYLWNFGVSNQLDRQFQASFQWDIPLLDGYAYDFVPNRSRDPGTHHFRGLDNPDLVERIAAWRPDAILLFGYAYLSHLRTLVSGRLARIPMLLRGDSHDIARSGGLKSYVNRSVRSLLFRRFSAFLAVGQANADYYRHSGVADNRIHFVPHCVDNDRFQGVAEDAATAATRWREEIGIPAAAKVVLFAGKFEQKKRPLDLLDAFLRLEERYPESNRDQWVLLFVGSGPLEQELHSRAGDRIGRAVFFAPFQNQSQMPKVYAAADLLVLPSGSETWGLAVNEAMNLERPVIVSSHVGCGPDLVVPGKTGWVFPAGNVDALARTLAEALREPDRLVAMGRAGREHIANYSYAKATAGLLAALDAVLTKR